MGHKVHPTGFRLGIIKGWESRWYADRNYKDLLAEDRMLRGLIRKRLANAGISRIEIERVAGTQIAISIHTAKPGIVIGKSGESVDRMRRDLEELTKKKVRLNILEIRNPDVEAYLVARSIADQLEKRISFRRAMKQAVQKTMRAGAKGVKVVMGGRLGGAEIARVEKESEGSVPLQTLRADVDFAIAEAHTTFGLIGVKVWIYHGDVLPDRQGALGATDRTSAAQMPAPGDRGDRGDRGGDRGARGGGDRGGRGGPGGQGGPRRGPGGQGGPGGDRGRGGPGQGGPRGGGSGPRPQGGAPRPPRPVAGPVNPEAASPQTSAPEAAVTPATSVESQNATPSTSTESTEQAQPNTQSSEE